MHQTDWNWKWYSGECFPFSLLFSYLHIHLPFLPPSLSLSPLPGSGAPQELLPTHHYSPLHTFTISPQEFVSSEEGGADSASIRNPEVVETVSQLLCLEGSAKLVCSHNASNCHQRSVVIGVAPIFSWIGSFGIVASLDIVLATVYVENNQVPLCMKCGQKVCTVYTS